MNEISNFVINLATLFTAIGTLLTVRVMNKQRKASYRPELILESVHFSGHVDHVDTAYKFPENWLKEDLLAVLHKSNTVEKEEISQNRFAVSLLNIGLGAAKDIKGFWSFPVAEIVKEINQLAKEELFSFKSGRLEVTTLGEHHISRIIIWEVEKKINFDYLLPVSIQNKSTMIKIPLTYITLISAFIYLGFSERKSNYSYDIPPLELFLEYFDIGETKHQTKIKVLFECEAYCRNFFIASLQTTKRL